MTRRRIAVLVGVAFLLAPAPAYAAGPHATVALSVAGILGSVFGSIGHALLGAFSWTIGLASKFVLTTIAALVKLLIPRSWVHQGLQIMRWIVAVPNYAGTVSSPSGQTMYGFAGINALRDLFMWLGIALAPLSLVYATGRAMIGEGDPVGIPLLRMLTVSVVIASYPYWWGQAAALADQVTNVILTVPQVSQGLYKLMDYAVGGVALGGWQLIDLALMGAIALELLGLIFLKVVLVLLGALLYATGPLMIGLVATRAGSALARAWSSAVLTLLGIGIAWATLFAVGALLIGDANTAGPLIAGNSAFGSIAGGLLLAVGGLASLWLCLKAAKEAGSLLRMQLSGLLVLAGSHANSGGAGTAGGLRARTSGSSLRDYGSRLAHAAGAANGELALAGAGGAALAGSARAGSYVGRRGLVGTAANGIRAGARAVTVPTAAALGHTRAGAVASRMARAGTASWLANTPSPNQTPPQTPSGSSPATMSGAAGRRNGRQTTSTTRPPAPAVSHDATASQSVNGPGGGDRSARRPGPVGAGANHSQNPPGANPARPAAPPPNGTTQPRPTPDSATPRPTKSRHSSSPPPPPPAVPPSSRKPAAGGGAPVDKPERAPVKRSGRRRRNPKRGGR